MPWRHALLGIALQVIGFFLTTGDVLPQSRVASLALAFLGFAILIVGPIGLFYLARRTATKALVYVAALLTCVAPISFLATTVIHHGAEVVGAALTTRRYWFALLFLLTIAGGVYGAAVAIAKAQDDATA